MIWIETYLLHNKLAPLLCNFNEKKLLCNLVWWFTRKTYIWWTRGWCGVCLENGKFPASQTNIIVCVGASNMEQGLRTWSELSGIIDLYKLQSPIEWQYWDPHVLSGFRTSSPSILIGIRTKIVKHYTMSVKQICWYVLIDTCLTTRFIAIRIFFSNCH